MPSISSLLTAQGEGAVKRTMKVFNNNACETLKNCFDCTEWEVLTKCSLEEATDIVTH